jgi:hypothetical protein
MPGLAPGFVYPLTANSFDLCDTSHTASTVSVIAQIDARADPGLCSAWLCLVFGHLDWLPCNLGHRIWLVKIVSIGLFIDLKKGQNKSLR